MAQGAQREDGEEERSSECMGGRVQSRDGAIALVRREAAPPQGRRED